MGAIIQMLACMERRIPWLKNAEGALADQHTHKYSNNRTLVGPFLDFNGNSTEARVPNHSTLSSSSSFCYLRGQTPKFHEQSTPPRCSFGGWGSDSLDHPRDIF